MSDPVVHGIFGAQFGDLEFDVGTSVRWNMFLVDDFHISDVNLGSQRYWVVNWDLTFPECEHDVLGINFFSEPVAFRQLQWQQAKKKLNIQPTDWVLWCDSHEGISFDNTTLPDDYDAAPFRSWIWREIARAEDALSDRVVLPFFAWVKDEEVQNIEYELADPDGNVIPDGQNWVVQQSMSVPYYEANQGLMRLCQASVIDDPGFDWTDLDTLATPDVDVKAQVVSYGYGHWNVLDIDTVGGDVALRTEDNDDGYRMRQKISQVRPLASFQTAAWDGTDTDLVGLPGPWGPDAHLISSPSITEEFAHTPPHPSMEGITTPLYNTVVRINLRDGIWYEAGVSGNIPLTWDSANQKWITHYNPEQWPDRGVAAWDFPEVPTQPLTLECVYTQTPKLDEDYEEYLDSQAIISWEAPIDSGSHNLLQYRIDVEKDGVLTTAGFVLPKKRQFRHTALDFATYRYQVVAINDVGESPPSDFSDPLIWTSATYYQDDEPLTPQVDETWQTETGGYTTTFDGADWVGYPAPDTYLTVATSLGAVALIDGDEDLISSNTWINAVEVAAIDSLTGIETSGGDAEITLPGVLTDDCTVCLLLHSSGLSTATTRESMVSFSGATSTFNFLVRRDAGNDQQAYPEYGPFSGTQTVGTGTGAGSTWTFMAIAVEENSGTPTNTDIYLYGVGTDGTLVEDSSPNRGSNTRPDGSAITITFSESFPNNVDYIAGVALFDSRLSTADIQLLVDQLPSLVP